VIKQDEKEEKELPKPQIINVEDEKEAIGGEE